MADAPRVGEDGYLERFSALIVQRDFDGARVVVEQARSRGLADAPRMLGLLEWLGGDRNAARRAWQYAVESGDTSAVVYQALAAHHESAVPTERLAAMATLAAGIRGPDSVEVLARISAASGLAQSFGAEETWAGDILYLLAEAIRDGSESAIDTYLRECGRTLDDVASDTTMEPALIGHLALLRGGMTAWLACANESLPERVAAEIVVGEAESLIRAIAGNEGLAEDLRHAATRRLHDLSSESGSAAPGREVFVEPSQPHSEALTRPSVFWKDERHLLAAQSPRPSQATSDGIWRTLLKGDYRAVLSRLDEREARQVPNDDAFIRSWALGIASAWLAEQGVVSDSAGSSPAGDLFQLLASGGEPGWELVGTVNQCLLALRFSPESLPTILDRIAVLLMLEEDGMPQYARESLIDVLDPAICHPWICQWFADLKQILDWVMEGVPIRAGELAVDRGDIEAGENLFRHEIGGENRYVAGRAVNGLAFGVLIPQQRYDEAEDLLIANVGCPWTQVAQNSRSNLGVIAFHRRELDRAHRLLSEVNESGQADALAQATYFLALTVREQGHVGRALQLLTEVMELGDATYSEQAKVIGAEIQLEHGNLHPPEMNMVGCRLRDAGDLAAARRAFLLSAAGGDANALASLIWPQLLAGDMVGACADFESCEAGVARYVEEVPSNDDERARLRVGLANARSNAGLAYLAMGERERALDLWHWAAMQGHIEARVYPLVLAWRDGDARLACTSLAEQVSNAEIKDIATVMGEVGDLGSGWLVEWAMDALDLMIAQEDADPLFVSNVAHWRFTNDGNRTQALEQFQRSAKVGVPSAIASLAQGLRLSGDPSASVSAFERYQPAMEAYLAALPAFVPEVGDDGRIPVYQGSFDEYLVDALVETGISYLLLGRTDDAARLWSDPRARRHPEAIVGRAALALRSGDEHAARRLVNGLLPQQRQMLDRDLRDWISSSDAREENSWYRECITALEHLPDETWIRRPMAGDV